MSDILSPRQTSAFGQVSDAEGVRRRFASRKFLRIHAENTGRGAHRLFAKCLRATAYELSINSASGKRFTSTIQINIRSTATNRARTRSVQRSYEENG